MRLAFKIVLAVLLLLCVGMLVNFLIVPFPDGVVRTLGVLMLASVAVLGYLFVRVWREGK